MFEWPRIAIRVLAQPPYNKGLTSCSGSHLLFSLSQIAVQALSTGNDLDVAVIFFVH